MKKIYYFLTGLFFVSTLVTPAWSFNYHAYKWREHRANFSLSMGSVYNSMFIDAMGVWESVEGASFDFGYNYENLDECDRDWDCWDPIGDGNAVEFKNLNEDGYCFNADASTALGVTKTSHEDGEICNVDILFNTHFTWHPDRTYKDTPGEKPFIDVAIHELGHGLPVALLGLSNERNLAYNQRVNQTVRFAVA
jgi:hypothetical protein